MLAGWEESGESPELGPRTDERGDQISGGTNDSGPSPVSSVVSPVRCPRQERSEREVIDVDCG